MARKGKEMKEWKVKAWIGKKFKEIQGKAWHGMERKGNA
jgi:hypothetical protein